MSDESKIQPALSRKEWAEIVRAEAAPKGYGSPPMIYFEYVRLTNGPHQLDRPDAMAALCLYGRITWEMVDALRDRISNSPGDHARFGPSNRQLREVADLLESLLPPREP